jgi:hypothetical protein
VSANPYRLPVVYPEDALVAPEPKTVSCEDCRWFGGRERLGAYTRKSCYLFSRDPYRPGDPRFTDLKGKEWEYWHGRWNWNTDGDCFGWQHKSRLVRLVKRLRAA